MSQLVTVAPPSPVKGISKRGLYLIFSLWIVLAMAGLVILMLYAMTQQERDMLQWQRQIGLSAEAKAAAVENWLAMQQNAITDIARNTSLQLYMGEIADASSESEKDEALALTSYLHNLLAVEADRQGFSEPRRAPTVNANVPQPEGAGIALFDASWQPVTAGGNFPAPDRIPIDAWTALQNGAPSPLGPLTLEASGEQYLLFYAPVVNVQMDSNSTPIAHVVGLKKLGNELAALLKPSLQSPASSEAMLLAKDSEGFRYLSPLNELTPARVTNASDSRLEPVAFAKPGEISKKLDYRNVPVWFTSQDIRNTPWKLVYKIDDAVVMEDSTSRFFWLSVSYALFAAFVTMVLIALWRHASAMRSERNSEYYRILAGTIERQQNLLALITSSTPNGIIIVDPAMHYRYVNKAAANEAGHEMKYMLGRTLHEVLGSEHARPYASYAAQCYQSQRVEQIVQEFPDAGEIRTVQSIFVPLQDIPLPDREENGPGVLIVNRDITDYARERRRHEGTLAQLVDTLVELVDSRDPYAQHHSNGVALVAKSLGEQLDLPQHLKTASIEAGKLMNVGKIRAPETLLTQESLSSSEKQNISRALHASADILRNIAFDAPVVETLEQAYEHVDGSGPAKMKEADILPSAQIVSLANAFIALISPRAYRKANSIDEAMETLRESVGIAYSRKVFAALENFIENGGGRATLEQWQKDQQKNVKKKA